MNDSPSSPLAPFAWVTKRDGRLVPFEADKICQALFAASEALGRPDAFVARELTDVVLHFLTAEPLGNQPTTAQIAELVIKVVRELGHGKLAAAFSEGERAKDPSAPPRERPAKAARLSGELLRQLEAWIEDQPAPVPLVWRAGAACLREYSRQYVFSRDVVAAEAEGLITLTGLEAPRELAACLLEPRAVGCGPWAVGERLLEAIEEARNAAGVFLAIDSPEFGLANCPQTPTEYARDLRFGLRANGLPAVLNLNCATPPVWADELAEGPLFAEYRQSPTPTHLAELADTLLEELALRHRVQELRDRAYSTVPICFASPVRIDWHLGPRDFVAEAASRLARVGRWVAEDAPLAFVFDRPRRPVPLAEGMDRQSSALLMTVGVHLPRLTELLPRSASAETVLQKLGSLVRLALSAAVQKREYLRSQRQGRERLSREFLIDRARVVVAPIGLEALVRKEFGTGLCSEGPGIDFALQVVKRLEAVLGQDGPACQLQACLDAPASILAEAAVPPNRVAGLTTWDSEVDVESQLLACGQLHGAGGNGTATIFIPAGSSPAADAVAGWLRYAWARTEIVRLRFARAARIEDAPAAAWVGQ